MFRGVWWTDLFEYYFICENCYYKHLAEGGEMWTGSTGDNLDPDKKLAEVYEESPTVEKCEWCKGPREAFVKATQ